MSPLPPSALWSTVTQGGSCLVLVALKVLVARFKIFLSTMFYIGHGWGQRNSVHLTRAYKGGKVGGNPKKVGTPSSNASNNTQKVDKIEAVKRRGGSLRCISSLRA